MNPQVLENIVSRIPCERCRSGDHAGKDCEKDGLSFYRDNNQGSAAPLAWPGSNNDDSRHEAEARVVRDRGRPFRYIDNETERRVLHGTQRFRHGLTSPTRTPARLAAGPSNMPVRTKPTSVQHVTKDNRKGVTAPSGPSGPSGPQSGVGNRLLRRQSLVLRNGRLPSNLPLNSEHVVQVDERPAFEKLLGKQLTSDEKGIFPLRQEFGSDQQDNTVTTNHFTIGLPETLYHYTIGLAENSRSWTLASRKRLIEAFFKSVNYFDTQESNFATDYLLIVAAWKELKFPALDAKLELEAGSNIRKSSPNERLVFSKKVPFGSKEELVAIYSHGQVDLATLKQYVEGQPGHQNWDTSIACQLLTTILSKAARRATGRHENFPISGNKIFIKTRWDPLDIDGAMDPKDFEDSRNLIMCYHGFSYVVKPAMGNMLLNLNSATSAFFQPHLVSDFIRQCLSQRSSQSDIERLLKRVRVYVDYKPGQTHTNKDDLPNRIRTIKGFGKPLDQEKFEKDNKTVSVYDHLVAKYKVRISKDSWCVDVSGKNEKSVWFAPEMLRILPYQRYDEKLSARQTSNMLKHACKRPLQKAGEILSDGLQSIGVGSSVLGQSSLSIDRRMLAVPSRRAPEAQLAFSAGREVIQVKDGQWKFAPGTKFLSTTTQAKGRFYYLSTKSQKDLDQLNKDFARILKGLGIQISSLPPKFTILKNDSGEEIRRGVKEAAKTSPALVILALETVVTRPYSEFKRMTDMEEGLQSLCMAKCWDEKTKRGGYLKNAAMKVNLKLGNINNSVKDWDTAKDTKTRKSGFGTAGDRNISKNVMILGADVTHPEAKSSPGTPSIAAVVGSVDGSYGKLLGSMRWQQRERKSNGKLKGSREIIDAENMKDMVKERLLAYKKVNGHLPKAILYYRDGVSEAQRLEVKETEVTAIKFAYRDLAAAIDPKQNTDIRVTGVIVNKRHGTRLFPNGGPTVKGNVPPGTVVDSVITSPYHFDFFLASHAGIQGTSRPAHYFVIQNEMTFTATELQDFTQKFCAIYVRATNSVSYAPAAYYADRLCDRGRHYLRDFIDGSLRFAYMTDDRVIDEVNKVWNRHKNPWHEKLNDTMFWM